jgi:hypothetical protein
MLRPIDLRKFSGASSCGCWRGALVDGARSHWVLAQSFNGVTSEYKADGIQQGVLDKLRLGKYTLDASLNLLRQPVETCRQSLLQKV